MKDDLIIVGGGITGLSAAYIAATGGAKVRVLEASPAFGGLLQTFEIGGNQLEKFYHHHFTHDAEFRWLLGELGIQDQLEFRHSSMGVFRDGSIYGLNKATDLLRFESIHWPDKLRFLLSSARLSFRMDWTKFEHVSAFDWLKQNSGRTAFESIWEPMLKVKFGSFAREVPLSWLVGRMRQRIQSRKSGAEKLGYLNGSLKVLLDSLLSKLNELGVMLEADSAVTAINGQERIEQIKVGEKTFEANRYLFTIPSPVLGRLLKPVSRKMSNQLLSQKYFGAACLILSLERALSDIYWLNMADQSSPFGGIIEHTNLIPSAEYGGRNIVYLSRYFSSEEEFSNLNDEAMKSTLLKGLEQRFPESFKSNEILESFLFRTNTAAPVCDLNFSKRVIPMKTGLDGLFLANMQHVYPDERSTNNSIRIAAEACKCMGLGRDEVPRALSLSGQIGVCTQN